VATPPNLASDRARALALTPVSRETEARLDRFAALLLEWQQRMNLIAASTEASLWTRHIADSLQLLPLAAEAMIWADLGTGAGFPGLALACSLADIPGARVHLVERSTKKAAFLREVVQSLALPAEVHAESAADFAKHAPRQIDAVTARALAPLTRLLAEAYPLLKRGATGLFPKGQDVEAELTDAAKCWNIEAALIQSRTETKARIVVVKSIHRL
jgi:16S rRNA (guanine527-N7)-methyltransferase